MNIGCKGTVYFPDKQIIITGHGEIKPALIITMILKYRLKKLFENILAGGLWKKVLPNRLIFSP
jgi:hypothetical protein